MRYVNSYYRSTVSSGLWCAMGFGGPGLGTTTATQLTYSAYQLRDGLWECFVKDRRSS